MTWEQLVQAMKDEGFGFEIDRERYDPNDLISSTTSQAWRVQLGIVSGTVYSDADDPRTALADLLAKCREAWPPKHRWDDLGLEALIVVCEERGWYPFVHKGQKINNGPNYWFASTGVGYPDDHFREPLHHRPDDALRDAMKRREQQEKGA